MNLNPIYELTEVALKVKGLPENFIGVDKNEINDLIEEYPHNSDLYHTAALLDIQDKNYDSALINMHKATNLNDQYHPLIHFQGSHLFLDMAVILTLLNKDRKAEESFEKAVFLDHLNQDAINRKSDYEDNVLSHYSSSFPIIADYHNKVKLSMHGYLFDPPDNYDKFQQVTKPMQEHDEAFKMQLKGQYESAINLYENVLSFTPKCRHSWHHMGQCFAYAKEYEKALECFEKSALIEEEIHEKYHYYAALQYYNRAAIYSQLKQKEMAFNDLTKAHNLDKNNATFKKEMSDFSQQLKKDLRPQED